MFTAMHNRSDKPFMASRSASERSFLSAYDANAPAISNAISVLVVPQRARTTASFSLPPYLLANFNASLYSVSRLLLVSPKIGTPAGQGPASSVVRVTSPAVSQRWARAVLHRRPMRPIAASGRPAFAASSRRAGVRRGRRPGGCDRTAYLSSCRRRCAR